MLRESEPAAEAVLAISRGLAKLVPGLPKRRGSSPMIPTYTTPVGLPKICLAFDWPTQMTRGVWVGQAPRGSPINIEISNVAILN